MKRAFTIFGSLLAASALAQATTYVRVEKDGSKTYSDRPLPGGQPVDIQPAQTYSAPANSAASNPSLSREEQQVLDAANFQYQCAISPRADETLQNPESVTLAVQLTPSLRPGDQVKFSLDGADVPNESNATSAAVQYPDRGTHTASVHVTDRSGKPLCDTSATFHVQRTNLNSPTRQGPPQRPNIPRPTPHTPPKG
ncbi:MAG TPA: DUF4124 domain-containing protein [Steroidobacteraceae bacterium]